MKIKKSLKCTQSRTQIAPQSHRCTGSRTVPQTQKNVNYKGHAHGYIHISKIYGGGIFGNANYKTDVCGLGLLEIVYKTPSLC